MMDVSKGYIYADGGHARESLVIEVQCASVCAA